MQEDDDVDKLLSAVDTDGVVASAESSDAAMSR